MVTSLAALMKQQLIVQGRLRDDRTHRAPHRSRKASTRDGAQPPPGKGAVHGDDPLAATRARHVGIELEGRQPAAVAEQGS
jgi:hypothetical protein